MKMPEFLNTPLMIGLILTLVASLFLLKGYQINSNKSTDKILDKGDSNKDEIVTEIRKSQEITKNIINYDFLKALKVFNSEDLNVKKGVIIELKNKAISDIKQKQKIIDFLGSLNDWITESPKYDSILLRPDIDWYKWKTNNEYFKIGDTIFEKEKQIISIEASNAIDEIIIDHIEKPTDVRLTFYKKNVLGFFIFRLDFGSKIDFLGANLFGVNFTNAYNILHTNFQLAIFYGRTIFKNVALPKNIYSHHEYGTKYNGEVSFISVQFPDGVELTDSYFKDDVCFLACTFHKDANFYSATFKKSISFDRSQFNAIAGFSNIEIKGKASFENSLFLGESIFKGIDFHEDVNFMGATFVINPIFDKTKMGKVKNLNINLR